MAKADPLETSKRIERALFDFEELKLRLASAHAGAAERSRPPAEVEPAPALPDVLEPLRRRVTELESALQAATLRRAELQRCAPAADAEGGLSTSSPSPPAASKGGEDGELRTHEAIISYLMEKLEETLTDRRRYFDRYTTLRELILTRSTLPHVAESSTRAAGEALSEMESRWILSDQALLEARLLRARGRHRRIFEAVRRKEYQVDEALRRAEARRPVDAAQPGELLQRLGALPQPAAWRWGEKGSEFPWSALRLSRWPFQVSQVVAVFAGT
ncbi:unnamed protein product [Symbiodinium natans]|uniref:Uncharacterized protein n=1 Tax=Symbiodinium natans TaxID=878477 RepID=A0A812IMU7_9DINO|nr:unnamed protein product [Symbiodinium natans]